MAIVNRYDSEMSELPTHLLKKALNKEPKKGKVADRKKHMAEKMGKHGDGYMTYIGKKK